MQLARSLICLAAALALFSPFYVYADDKRFYLGARYAEYKFELDGSSVVEEPNGFGIVGGMHMTEQISMEFEYGRSNKADFNYRTGLIESGKLRTENLAVYGAYRTPGTVYAKLKAGISINWVDASDIRCYGAFCVNTLSEDGGGLAYGIGLGTILLGDQLRAEVDYSVIEEDIEMLSRGVLISL